MKKSRLEKLHTFLDQHILPVRRSQQEIFLISFLGHLLKEPHHSRYARKDDEEISFEEFCGFCINHNRADPQDILETSFFVHPLIRNAFNNWRLKNNNILGYANTETSIGLVDILEIPPQHFIILADEGKKVCFDKRELLQLAEQERPACFRSPQTNTLFSPNAIMEMEKHDELKPYALAIRDFYTRSQEIDAGILDRLYELLQNYLKIGTKPDLCCLMFTQRDLGDCDLLRFNFLQALEDFPATVRQKFLDSVVFVNYIGGYQPIALSVHDVFYGSYHRCIMVEQINLWVLLTTHRPYIKFPSLVKNVREAEKLALPPGVSLDGVVEHGRGGAVPRQRPLGAQARAAAQPYGMFRRPPLLRRRDQQRQQQRRRVHFGQQEPTASL